MYSENLLLKTLKSGIEKRGLLYMLRMSICLGRSPIGGFTRLCCMHLLGIVWRFYFIMVHIQALQTNFTGQLCTNSIM